MTLSVRSIVALTGLFLFHPGSAQLAGDIDTAFATNGSFVDDGGFQDVFQDVVLQPDGKIIGIGVQLDSFFATELKVTRLMQDGTRDQSFGSNGEVNIQIGAENYGYAGHVLPDGKILIAGGVSDGSNSLQFLLTRLNEDGTTDISFGLDGSTFVDFVDGREDLAQAMTVQDDGKILLAGYVTDTLANVMPAIYRFTENGFLDDTFGDNGLAVVPVVQSENDFSSIAVRPDGHIVASGHYSEEFNEWGILVAQFDGNGQLDASFGTNGFTVAHPGPVQDDCYGMQLLPSGDLLLTGLATTADFYFHMFVGRMTATGSMDATFGTNGFTLHGEAVEQVAYACTQMDDGKVLVAGTSGGTFFDNRDIALWRFNSDGTPDLTFSDDGLATADISGNVDEAYAMVIQPDGKAVVAGKASNGNDNDFLIARFQTTGTIGIVEPHDADMSISPNPVRAGEDLRITRGDGHVAIGSLIILDATGRVAASVPVNAQASPITLRVPAQLAAGAYEVRSLNANGVARSAVRLIIAR